MTRTPRPALLEVCVDTVDGIAAATEGGAGRLELCSALSLGGLTPSASLIRVAAAKPLPVHLLARPREGGFAYTAAERALVADDIRTAAEAGLAGVVVGASGPDRRLDAATLAEWAGHARALGAARGTPLSLTLHRAFDLVPDPAAALDLAMELGFDRVLTSGGATTAVEGLATLAMLIRRAAGRIVILAGGGVRSASLPSILSTGVREVHASCRRSADVPEDMPERRYGFIGASHGRTDVALVSALALGLSDARPVRNVGRGAGRTVAA